MEPRQWYYLNAGVGRAEGVADGGAAVEEKKAAGERAEIGGVVVESEIV